MWAFIFIVLFNNIFVDLKKCLLFNLKIYGFHVFVFIFLISTIYLVFFFRVLLRKQLNLLIVSS